MKSIRSVKDILKLRNTQETFWFRGQPSSEFKLLPTIFRKNHDKFEFDEYNILMEYKIRNTSVETSHYHILDWLTKMQHHGIPTRLLDWTENVLVALYFAVREMSENNGSLFVLSPGKLNLISSHNQDGYIGTPESIGTLLRTESLIAYPWKNLLNHIKTSFSFGQHYATIIKPDEYDIRNRLVYPYAIHSNNTSQRMKMQSGVFTVHAGSISGIRSDIVKEEAKPLEEIEIPNPFLKRYEIPKEAKSEIMDELDWIGIRKSTVFPEHEHEADFYKRKWKLN